jgi:hypothetical protein
MAFPTISIFSPISNDCLLRARFFFRAETLAPKLGFLTFPLFPWPKRWLAEFRVAYIVSAENQGITILMIR